MIRRRGRDPHSVLQTLDRLGYQDLKHSGHRITFDKLKTRGFNARFVCLPAKASAEK